MCVCVCVCVFVCVSVFTSVGLVDRGSLRLHVSVKLSVLIRILFVPPGTPLSIDTFI